MPAPNQKGSPETSITTRRPRCSISQGSPVSNGTGHVLVAAVRSGISARWRTEPVTSSAAATAARAAGDRPAAPSSPIPTIVSHGASVITKILILGGTTEASALAARLAERGDEAVLSYAGRVALPKAQPLPVRIGGFGGIDGLADHLRAHRVTHLIDATHPFAAQISAHAVAAAARAGVPLAALTRPRWTAVAGDRWTHVADIEAAVAALAGPARRVMLALGRMHVEAFAAQPQHHYLLRFVDAPSRAPTLPRYDLIVDRGPFDVAGDTRLMRAHGIDLLLCKNAGGTGAEAKLTAARALALPVMLIDRPTLPPRTEFFSVADVLDWIDHGADRGV